MMEFNVGYVTTPLGRKLSKSNLTDMNAQQIIQYMLQTKLN